MVNGDNSNVEGTPEVLWKKCGIFSTHSDQNMKVEKVVPHPKNEKDWDPNLKGPQNDGDSDPNP